MIKQIDQLGPIADGALLLTCTCGEQFSQESWEPNQSPIAYTKKQQLALLMKQHQNHIEKEVPP